MDINKASYFKEMLKDEKDRRVKALNSDKFGLDVSIRDATSELSSYDNHPGDLGTETFETEKNMSFRNNDKFVISEIDTAMRKMDNGTYGKCEACKDEIPEERLEILPYTRFCIECEKDFELKSSDVEHGRPIEEQVLFPPFGRSFTDDSLENKTGYDGEDAWEDVNEYNVITSDNAFEKEETIGAVEDVERVSNNRYRKSLE